ncbi:hypothetical protein Q9R19_12060 [Microbacterium sp. ARD32]|uniref:HAAS signaling domain-containing protein n=1 Tax=Microbacterium sp. ARD32 TaxID=2962577 RepID=UPI002880D455|nr:hypothetical protein [Microbacterium sp. ARD32]MDT0158364.1 hypothetical protein [Microbacterium sp. ARD32]
MTLTSDYLHRLDLALRDVPHGVAAEIRAGIAEELQSLEPDAAQARIAQLGDPAQIAREALDAGEHAASTAPVPAASAPPVVVVAPPASGQVSRSRGFAIAAALTLSFGGFVVPVIGWFVGAVLVLTSSIWRTWEKVVAIVVPFALFALILVVTLPAYVVSGPVEVHEETGTFAPPEAANPLVPSGYDISWTSLLLLLLLAVPASGLWLLWRMRGRPAS